MTLFSLLLKLQTVPRFTVFILNFKHKRMYLHTTAALWHVRKALGIWSETPFSFVPQPRHGNAFRTELLHCFVINWYHSLSSLTVSLFRHWTGKLCHVCNVFQLVLLLFEEKQINSPIHKCKMNTCLPYYTLQICVLQLCSEAGSWGVSHSSGMPRVTLWHGSLRHENFQRQDRPAMKVMCGLLCMC